MTAQECAQQIVSIIIPELKEFGMEGGVIAIYLKGVDDEGKEHTERVVIADGGNNVVVQDGLRGMVMLAGRWKDGVL